MAVATKQGFLRQAWDLAWPYWKSDEKWSAIGLLAAVIASLVPAARAARVDVIQALRTE